MVPNWVLSAPDGPHVGPMNLVIRVERFPGISRLWNKSSGSTNVGPILLPAWFKAWIRNCIQSQKWHEIIHQWPNFKLGHKWIILSFNTANMISDPWYVLIYVGTRDPWFVYFHACYWPGYTCFLRDQPWITSISYELDITFHVFGSQLRSHNMRSTINCDVITSVAQSIMNIKKWGTVSMCENRLCQCHL